MDTQTRYLWIFVAALVFLASLFTWSIVYRQVNTFAVGTRPSQTPTIADPTLPPLRPTDPRIGSSQSNATEVVEFGDYRCLHCRAMTPDLINIINDTSRNVRLVWREAPVQDQTREGLLPFAAARCAEAQNKFGLMHPSLYQLTTFDEASILSAAKSIGLNMSQFQSCINNSQLFDQIRADQQTAIAANITAAPTLFVHGIPYVGLLDRSQLDSILR